MQGSSQPWNVAIVIDSTGSMATVDSNCGSLTEFQCALSGVQALLGFCQSLPLGRNLLRAANQRCHSEHNREYRGEPVHVSQRLDQLQRHRGELAGRGDQLRRQPLHMDKLFQPAGGRAVHLTHSRSNLARDAERHLHARIRRRRRARIRDSTWEATYQITPFLSDYYSPASSTTGGLNTSSNLVKAVGYGSTSGCLTYTFGIWWHWFRQRFRQYILCQLDL